MAYGDFKDLNRRTAADKVLKRLIQRLQAEQLKMKIILIKN